MKVVDTFLFAEAYEAELLLIKLTLESPVVNEWVLVESSQTFRGEEKGLQARKLIYSDERFAPFRDRIVLVEQQGRPFEGPPCYQTYYQNEERSRAMAWAHVDANYSDDDWFLVSDVDEAVDGTDPERAERFLGHLSRQAGRNVVLRFGHYRYWYDFDNRCYWAGIVTPAVRVGAARRGAGSTRARSTNSASIDVPAEDLPLFFEYTFCFPPEGMWKKLNSFIHDGYTREDLERALLTNHWVKSPQRGEKVGGMDVDWLETVELIEQNSPAYVRENLARLKTGVIPADYREHRKRLYGK